ncbi:hypothetical protein [Paenibacillus nasutitermitis]|uniref:Alpha-galactosidase n=1 Tax=Paenibacillus nasutitermitis TaxID=1652958 RepID=A0A917E2G4_9BACL|nr:hypothetical protein [Paenibacillus nasutitermitis]GGD98440.1 hypothetical protein GCM10010911_66550 [Paenibacillus nasutitermitis]
MIKRWAALLLFFSILFGISQFTDQKVSATGDAYVNFDSVNKIWTIGTDAVEKKLHFNSSGQFLLTSFKNKATGQEYIQGGQISDEFSIKVGTSTFNGIQTGWTYDTYTTTTLSQGETQLVITFHNSLIKVNRYYIIYHGTGIIQEYSVIQNISGVSQYFSDPSIFRQRIMSNDVANTDFYYMTGGANFRGSQILKPVTLTTGYARTFDSQDAPELMMVDGSDNNSVMDDVQGTSIYNLFYAMRNRSTNSGMFLLFDYFGHWNAQMGNYGGKFLMNGKVFMSNYSVAHNASITTPKALTGVFTGDIDDMGNTILNYVYTFKWDYTREQHMMQLKAAQLSAGIQTDNLYQITNNLRYVGGDSVWMDDFWFDQKGNWDALYHDDYPGVVSYAAKSGMSFIAWNPPWHVKWHSKVLTENPTWQVGDDEETWYGLHLNLAIPEVNTWIRNYLNNKQATWGTHVFRYDGQPIWTSYGGTENDQLAQSNNFLNILKTFKDDNPLAGIFGCASGGELLSIEATRYSDSQATTDDGAAHYIAYWNSLFTPIDKVLTGGVGMNNASNPDLLARLEGIRVEWEMYRFLRTQGVMGRWVKIYRPTLNTGDETYYIQKMSADRTKGYIEAGSQPLSANRIVYPKGLLPTANYTIATQGGSMATATNTGSYWMTNGIPLTIAASHEFIYLNLENRPGAGTPDTTAPTVPTNVVKKQASYLGHSGIELTWTASTDNKFLSYYEIFKNGVSVTKVSKGTFYFGENGSVTDNYQIKAVDSHNNKSAFATGVFTNTNVYKLSTDLSSVQGGNNWSYLQSDGTTYSNMTWSGTQWVGAYPLNVISSPMALHPDTNDSVIAWTAPQTGTVTLNGTVAKGAAGGDGVKVKIMKNSTQIWPASGWQLVAGSDTIGYIHQNTISVTAGDKLYLIVNKNANTYNDTTVWDARITYGTPETITQPLPSYSATADFTGMQGKYNWYYQQLYFNTYTDMTWNPLSLQWTGSTPYTLVGLPEVMHPDVNDAVRSWIAPKTGVVRLTGAVVKTSALGNGVNVKINKDSTLVWPSSGWQYVQGTTRTGITYDISNVSVTQGQILYFIVQNNGDSSNDSTNWNPKVTYTSIP